MAKTGAVWGIDLGQCALKALRCRAGDNPNQIVAEAFDYIEYPRILSQPEANPAELIAEALQQFLSRNSVRGDRVAISVSGQSGLARFIKLPPVESKKIPDIVKYEARQQIPFALDDVVWDYQRMAGGSEEEGFALETEVGLFAMKRDQVNRALKPFTDAGIEIDIVQLTPLALYNFISFDQLSDLPPPDQYDPENPPDSTIVLSLGADMSDLVVTNGYRVWNRTINLGGSHFTKALTKQMKLTFAKAEHLKRNAMKAEDPKAVFQAMRPTFGELLGEVQRSLSFFQNLDRSAKLGRVVALGNAMKLRGLHKYLLQNLGLKVEELDSYRQLTGPAVVNSPAFKDNILSFAVCYGLAVQALGKGKLNTNLLPPEILKERMIREKKPWAVAAVATLLLGCTIGFFGSWREWDSAYESDAFKKAFQAANDLQQYSTTLTSSFEEAKTQHANVVASGKRVASIGERRLLAAEMMKAVTDCLPRDPEGKTPEAIEDRNELHVETIDMAYLPDLKVWFESVKPQWERDQPKATPATPPAGEAGAEAAEGDGTTPPMEEQPMETPPGEDGVPAAVGPDGPGWVVRLVGHHYHNHSKYGATNDQGPEYVRRTLLTALREKDDVVVGPDGTTFTMKELGIDFPVLVTTETKIIDTTVTNPNAVVTGTPMAAPIPGRPGTAPMPPMGEPGVYPVRRYDFEVQFVWKPTTLSERLENRMKKEQQPNEAQELARRPE